MVYFIRTFLQRHQTLLPFDYFEAFGIFVSETDEVNQSKPSKVERRLARVNKM